MWNIILLYMSARYLQHILRLFTAFPRETGLHALHASHTYMIQYTVLWMITIHTYYVSLFSAPHLLLMPLSGQHKRNRSTYVIQYTVIWSPYNVFLYFQHPICCWWPYLVTAFTRETGLHGAVRQLSDERGACQCKWQVLERYYYPF